MKQPAAIFAVMLLSVEQVAKLPYHHGSIYSLAHAENESSFYSAGGEGIVVRWHVEELNKPVAVAKVEAQIFALHFLPKKNQLLIGTMSGGFHVIDLNEKKEVHYFTIHEQSIFDIKEHDGKIFVCSKDGTLSVWDAEDFHLDKVIVVSTNALRCIVFHPTKNQAAIGSSDNSIYLLDLEELKISGKIEGPSNSVFSLQYLRNGEQLIAGSRDAQLYVYDLKEMKLQSQIKAHLYTINDLVFILGRKCFATASRDKTIRIWSAENFELIKSLDREKNGGHINSVNKLLWLPSRQYLVSCSDDRSLILWKIDEKD